MGLRFPSQEHGQCFFVTTTFINHCPLGDMPGFYTELEKSLEFCAGKYGAKIAGYVFMPDHIHLLIFIDGKGLSSFMRDFKKYTAQKIAREFGIAESSIWMPRYHRVVVHSDEVFGTKLRYIHENPVRKGLVQNSEDWQWSSASDYLVDVRGGLEIWKDWA